MREGRVRLIVFDLDGTLAESKSPMDQEMSELLGELLSQKLVAVISGGAFPQFEKQFLASLDVRPENLPNLYLLPTCASSLYRYLDGKWEKVYEEVLTTEEKRKIFEAFERMFHALNYEHPKRPYGEIIEDRGTQITFSALGQEAPLELKCAWDPDQKKRLEMVEVLELLLPESSVRIGGMTSIDVTRKGIDKAYGIRKIVEQLSVNVEEIIFIGDALFEGGNDYPVRSTGVVCVSVQGPAQTKEIIRVLLKQ